MIRAFPKIFALGTDYIKDIFLDEVEITEKIDGSQFDFGLIEGQLYCRSKGKEQHLEAPDKMFKEAVDYACLIQDKLEEGLNFYCEYLKNPAHNILNYARIPKNHLILFAISQNEKFFDYEKICKWANILDIEVVPKLPIENVSDIEEFKKILETDSILGGQKIEGVVVKNYHRPFLLGGQPIPVMAGKYVSEVFKETHREKWGKSFTSKGKWEEFKESFRTEARWEKAIQHLRDNGELLNDPKDIGKLLIEIKKDIGEEEKENIKKFLWKEFGDELLRGATKGFPEWYKEKLLSRSFK